MKINLLLLLFTLGLLYSCYRPHNAPLPNVAPEFNIFTEHGNIKDSSMTFSINDSSSFDLRLVFNIISGNPNNYPVNCFISGLPPGVTFPQDSSTFELNYSLDFTFTVNSDTGLFPFYINVRTPKGLTAYKEYLHVLPTEDAAPRLVGNYSGSDPCGHFSIGDVWYTYTSTVSTVPARPHWVTIKNFKGLGDSIIVYAFVSLYNATSGQNIDIPVQTIDGYTIFGRGKGYYGIDEQQHPWISIYGDTIVHAGDTQTCYTQLKQ